MKKLALILILALIAAPALALEEISDADLNDVVGQSGVSITSFGPMIVDVQMKGLAWGDDDGYAAGTGSAGHVRIDAIDGVGVDTLLTVGVTWPSGGVLTIDVDSVDGIVLGLPAFVVNIGVPAALRISVGATEFASWGAAPVSADILGYLGFNNLAVAFTAPAGLAIAPH